MGSTEYELRNVAGRLVLAQPVADAFVGVLTAYSARVERSGLLLSAQQATLNGGRSARRGTSPRGSARC
jgi:hypothetical protein